LFPKKDKADKAKIHFAPAEQTFDLNGHKLTLTIKDAQYLGDELLDDVVINDMFKDIAAVVSRNVTKYNPLPTSILISNNEGTEQTDTEVKSEPADTIRSFSPRWTFEDVCADESAKSQILSTLTIIKNQHKLYQEWGLGKIFKQNRSIVLNFYGKPGTGKTMMAEAIANNLGKNVYQVNYAELESKYVGETPKNIVDVFKKAQADEAVLVFDEADSFLGKRLTNVSQSADYGVNITRSVMLMEIEKYEGVVVFTTNLISNYDEAFKRRIFTSVEFKMPNAEARTRIWKTHIPKELPLAKDITCQILGGKYEDISGADIKDMLMSAAASCIQDREKFITLRHFDAAHKYIKNRYEGGEQFGEARIVSSKTITQEQYDEEMAKAGV
jgi:SpoVK/Ycf46/Vps4 family AAA+-type ATPase